jgi:hypothetical protein
MKRSHIVLAAAALVASACAFAQSPPAEQAPTPAPARLEITMTLLPENAKDAHEITRKIELPPAVTPTQPRDGKSPPSTAGQGNGKEGLEKAAEARERGREFGQDVADQARDNREKASRGVDPPGPPADRPVPPGNGTPPDTTPGRGKP